MTVGPPQVDGGAQRISHTLGGGLSCAFDHGAASPLEDFYDPLMVDALQAHLVSEEPPMWVIDAPPQTEPSAGDEVVGWIRPFIEYVEEQTGAEALWEPFNTKNALHQPPERCWVESSAPVGGGPAEKLAGLQAFLRLASGGGGTFMDKGRPFAVKRYPHAGAPEGAESLGGGGAEFYAAETQHIDRLQRCPDQPQPEEGEAKLYGEPTHFTLVVGFDEATGGTFFPHGRLLPGLESLPDGVSHGAGGGILVQSMRGRALLWSNHRGSVDPASGAAVPLLSSLHQSVLMATDDSSREPRRVCIFGWAQEGRKWERSGFHECLEYESPKVRADFFGRTLLQELEGWEDGHRAREVKYHLRNPDVQKEIQEGLANNTLSETTRNWLQEYGYTDKSSIFQLMIDQMGDGRFSWSFLTLGGNEKYSFRVPHKSMKLEDLVTRLKENFPVETGHVVSRVEALDHLTRQKVENPQRLIQQGEQVVIVVKTAKMSTRTTSTAAQTASTGSQATGSQTVPQAAATSTATGSGGYPPAPQPQDERASTRVPHTIPAAPSTAAGSGGYPPAPQPQDERAPGRAAPSTASGGAAGGAEEQPAVAAQRQRAVPLIRKAGTENFTSKHLDIDIKEGVGLKRGADEDEGEDEGKDEGNDTAAAGASSFPTLQPALHRAATAGLGSLRSPASPAGASPKSSGIRSFFPGGAAMGSAARGLLPGYRRMGSGGSSDLDK